MKKNILTLIGSISALILSACATIPEGAKSVTSFDKNKYLGKWNGKRPSVKPNLEKTPQ